MISRRRMWVVGTIYFLLSAALTSAQIKIDGHPPAVKTRNFDPKAPPAEMPPLNPGEAAVCESKFACGVQVEVEITQPGDGSKPTAKVTAVHADLRLTVVIWLPEKAAKKIRDHEEGHRRISEIFYDRGEQTAQALAEKYIGKPLDIAGIEQHHTRPAIEKLASEFCQEYLGAIEVPSQKVQEEYDRLTDHGRNGLSEKKAIEQAMAKVEKKSDS